MSTTSSASARRAVRADVPHVLETLRRAFDRDPLFLWLLRQDGRRHAAYDELFERALRDQSLANDAAFVAADCGAVALWVPPSRWQMGFAEQLSLAPAIVRCAGLGRTMRALAYFRALEGHHPREPHWYLLMLAVDPTFQGQGFASRVVIPILDRCDHEKVGAYLECSDPKNVDLYRHYGFEEMGLIKLPSGPPLLPMWRAPR